MGPPSLQGLTGVLTFVELPKEVTVDLREPKDPSSLGGEADNPTGELRKMESLLGSLTFESSGEARALRTELAAGIGLVFDGRGTTVDGVSRSGLGVEEIPVADTMVAWGALGFEAVRKALSNQAVGANLVELPCSEFRLSLPERVELVEIDFVERIER